jgi:hypothetical protein
LFVIFEELPVQPEEYPAPRTGDEVSEEQRRQCKEIFDIEEARMATIETKGDVLFTTVVVLVPLCLGALTFMWQSASNIPAILFGVFSTLCLFSLLCLLGAIVAVIRIRNVSAYQAPGVDAVLDPVLGAHRKYDRTKDAYCLLWCASMNSASASLRVDFLRAGQLLCSGALLCLTLAAIPLGSTLLFRGLQADMLPKDRTRVESRLEALERAVQIGREETHPKDAR